MSDSLPLVTFGIVNCNRLHYLKSCFRSLELCTRDYENREFIIVDNASTEEGTSEFLAEVEGRADTRVFREAQRDPPNEFAKGLNTIKRNARGDYVCPLQGDMQFTASGGWLRDMVEFCEQNKRVGCIVLDAQRTITNRGHSYGKLSSEHFALVENYSRRPVAGAGDVFYPRAILDEIGDWKEQNQNHEGTQDSETAMNETVMNLVKAGRDWYCFQTIVPVAVAIYTDDRGTNARVRGNKRYGKYWPPHEDEHSYYEIFDTLEWMRKFQGRNIPVGIEEIAIPVGWSAPIDEEGNWRKNPIRPETASSDDFVVISDDHNPSPSIDYIDEWLA